MREKQIRRSIQTDTKHDINRVLENCNSNTGSITQANCLLRVSTWMLLSPDAARQYTYEETIIVREHVCLVTQLRSHLQAAQENVLNTEVLMPDHLLNKIAKDILTTSNSEPCGLRGCVIYLTYQSRTCDYELGRIVGDEDCVPTFEIYVRLQDDSKKWFSLHKLIPVLEKFIMSKKKPILLSSNYQIETRRLY